MRMNLLTRWCVAAALLAGYGCKGEQVEEPEARETTSGGDAGAQQSGAAGAPAEESPWGATRAEQCRRAPRPTFSDKARREIDGGAKAAAAGDATLAEQRFQAALKRDAGAYPALYNLGVLADRAGKEDAAIAYYRRALGIVADYEPAARGIATIYIRRAQPMQALALVEPLANAHRSNLEIQALYAEVLVEVKRYEEAWMAASSTFSKANVSRTSLVVFAMRSLPTNVLFSSGPTTQKREWHSESVSLPAAIMTARSAIFRPRSGSCRHSPRST